MKLAARRTLTRARNRYEALGWILLIALCATLLMLHGSRPL